MEQFIIEYWKEIALCFCIIEKIVKATPTDKDDIIFDMIITPIFNNLKKKVGKSE